MKIFWKPWGDFLPFVLLGVLASIISIISFVFPKQVQFFNSNVDLPEPMTGEFNIAVAHFGQGTKDGLKESEIAAQISNLLFNFLDSEYNSINFGVKVQVSHKDIPVIEEDAEAEKIAKDINADVVIFGNVQIFEGNAEFFPRFYIAERPAKVDFTSPGFTELAGISRLESPITFALSDLSFQAPLNKELRSRANILISFIKGLTYFSGNKLEEAQKSFEECIGEAKRFGPFKGKEILYLLLAITNTHQKKYDSALANLAETFNINSEYARGYIAKGNVFYIQTINDWSQNKLDQAANEYQKALKATDQPIGAYITEKANVSLGNIFVVQAQQTNNSTFYENAIAHYDSAIRTFNIDPNQKTKSLAANAYFGLGVAYEKQNLYTQAYHSYQRSAELATENALISRARMHISLLINQDSSLISNLDFIAAILATTQAAFGHLIALIATNTIYHIKAFKWLFIAQVKDITNGLFSKGGKV